MEDATKFGENIGQSLPSGSFGIHFDRLANVFAKVFLSKLPKTILLDRKSKAVGSLPILKSQSFDERQNFQSKSSSGSADVREFSLDECVRLNFRL